MAGNVKGDAQPRRSPWRIARWSAAALVLLLPLAAMQFTDEVDWTLSDFVFAGILLSASLAAYELVARRTGDPCYRAGAGLAVAALFLLSWSNAAVGITDSEALDFLGSAIYGNCRGLHCAIPAPGTGADDDRVGADPFAD